MHSNIEQAVSDVIASKQEVIISTVLSAYIRVAGFADPSTDVLTAFERALDKHPDSADKVDSPSSKLIAVLRQDYLLGILNGDNGEEYALCPCCGTVMLVEDIIRAQLVTELLDEEEKSSSRLFSFRVCVFDDLPPFQPNQRNPG